ncbi:MAG TPA: hypothetical protein VMW16_17115 [Sedimentisphaerales bacterium]|nr:hypothetical protein [Sedimentisphaerales bacterium]
MKREKKTKEKSSKQWGGLPAIPGLKLGRDFVARMCSLSAYPMFLVNYAIEHNLPLCERNHLISAYNDEYLEFLSLMKDFCADELNIHATQDRVDLYKEWDALYLRYSDWLKEMLGNKSVNLNDANLVKDKEQLWTSLALFNKTALYGRISQRELETKINKIITRTDVSKLPVDIQNFIKEADFDYPLRQDPVTGKLIPFEGKEPLWMKGVKDLQCRLKNKQLSNAIDTDDDEKLAKILPIKVEGLWNVKNGSLVKLRTIDSNPNGTGIKGNKKERNNLKYYLRKHRKRPDIADTLYWEDGCIKTKLAHNKMFSQE